MSDYYDLGTHSRPVTTTSADAQLWFDRGLNWTYGFNHNEAVACFKKALAADPTCVMAHWGICYAVGPNYNFTWPDFPPEIREKSIAAFSKHYALALEGLDNATPAERALVTALGARQVTDPELKDFDPYCDAYAEAMRKVYAGHPTDLDICALTAEALMGRTPWKLWNLQAGLPAEGADTAEAMALLEMTFANHRAAHHHPGLLHMYIHLMEMSPHPEKALKAGDALNGLMPDSGHLLHMATHIDVLCGQYQNVVTRNAQAWKADQKFLAERGPHGFYTTYMCHNLHFLVYGAMFLGQIQPALDAATDLENLLTPDVMEPATDWLESFYPMRYHTLIRFGRWEEILNLTPPEDAEIYAYTHATDAYAKSVACSALGRVAEAEGHRDRFYALRDLVPESRMLLNNRCFDVLNVAAEMLEGELAYRKGDYDTAFAHLRKTVELDDNMPYEEPWGWMQPSRHALGALLLEQGHVEEAEAVYRADLGLDGKLARACQNPDNVWALHGLHECLLKTGQGAEARLIKQRLDIANARADAPITASCFCSMAAQ